MSEVVLTEIIEDMDLDNDGHVSIDEYIRDILDEEDLEPGLKDGEISNFKDNLDLNKDGVMDRQEVCKIKINERVVFNTGYTG